MECRDVQNLLHPFVDGELDLVRYLQIEHHLADCTECADRERGLRQLREVIATPALYHRAPDSLRAKLQAAPAPAPASEPAPASTPARPRRRVVSVLVATAAGIALLAAPVFAVAYLLRTTAEERLSEQVVASHVRSLLVSRPTDIPSSNQHQVKPWFRGRVNFAPQVPDLAADGFALAGGRMDYLIDRPVAAIVYYRREHPINVFTWPAADIGEHSVRTLHRQGFHIRWWQNAGMVYWVISDLNPQELDEFVRLFQSHATLPPP